jgi:signal transduction histidine kinase
MPAEEVAEIHNDVYRAALRLHRTLRNYLLVLDLQGAPPTSRVPVLSRDEVEQTIQAGITEGSRQYRREADLVVHLKPVPLAVRRSDLSRLVEELVDNACKFSRQGTPVTIRLTQAGHLSVADQGRGMSAEEIDQIGLFRQFERRQQEQQGLGIGLVLVQRLVALYGAQFLIKSAPGTGTEVRVVFHPDRPPDLGEMGMPL